MFVFLTHAVAETEFREAVEALDAAAGKLSAVRALVSWSKEPTQRAYKQRAVMVPIPRHSDSEPPLDAVTGGLRRVIEPPLAPEPVEPQAIPASMVANLTPD